MKKLTRIMTISLCVIYLLLAIHVIAWYQEWKDVMFLLITLAGTLYFIVMILFFIVLLLSLLFREVTNGKVYRLILVFIFLALSMGALSEEIHNRSRDCIDIVKGCKNEITSELTIVNSSSGEFTFYVDSLKFETEETEIIEKLKHFDKCTVKIKYRKYTNEVLDAEPLGSPPVSKKP